MFPPKTLSRAQDLIEALSRKGWMIVTAESCTGGLIAGALTAIPGSSAAVHGGYVTYANAAKEAMIHVPPAMIQKHGAVSEQVAKAMAKGAKEASGMNISIAVTGIAGPEGGTRDKPVGLVHIACTIGTPTHIKTSHLECRFGEIGRQEIRLETVHSALELALKTLGDQE